MKTVADRVKILEMLNSSKPPELEIKLSKSLTDRSPTIRGFAVELIEENELTKMLPKVLPMVRDRDSEVRALAIDCIASLAEKDFPVRAISEHLFDEDELVRVAAAEALAEFENAEALIDLYKALNDKSSLVRSFVAEAIGSIGDKKSISVLEKYLKTELDERAKLGFYIGLSNLDKRDVLQNLIDLFQSDDYGVRSAVINSFDQISLSENSSAMIKSFLKDAYRKEKTVAVKGSIENALSSFAP